MTYYVPELGQAFWGNPVGAYAMPEHAQALFESLIDEVGRIYWNREQETWEHWEEPNIPGIPIYPYWWGDEDAPEAERPNFTFEDVEIRWYKHTHRGLSCNREMTPEQWCSWYERCLKHLQDYERSEEFEATCEGRRQGEEQEWLAEHEEIAFPLTVAR